MEYNEAVPLVRDAVRQLEFKQNDNPLKHAYICGVLMSIIESGLVYGPEEMERALKLHLKNPENATL